MLFIGDERDENLEEEDADFLNSEEEEEEESDEEDGEESEESDEEEDDDDKPVTRKELKELLKSTSNKNNARDRVSSKKKNPVTKQPSDLEKTVAELKAQNEERAFLDKKRDFAIEHKLSKRQNEYVFKLTKRPTAKFLNQPAVKAGLEAIKAQENISRNTPSGSGKRGKGVGGEKKWTELPAEERQSGFADRRRSILARNRQ